MTTHTRLRSLSLAAGLALAAAAHASGILASSLAGGAECAHCRALLAEANPTSNPIDPATGRDSRTYAPSPGVDFKHMRLELTVLDMNTPVMQGRQVLTVTAPGRNVSTLRLDARLLAIDSVTCEGRKATFTHDGSSLTLTFDPPIAAGATADIVTTYEVRTPIRGLFWTPESPAWPGRPAQIHSQGQPETNSYWFPCHDFPNDKLTTELVVIAPQGYEVVSNGRLAEKTARILDKTDASGDSELEPYNEWRWSQDTPHVNYLVSLIIGKFDVVDLGTPKLPMPIYAPVGRGHDARATYGRTPRMIEFFGQRLGEAYPWDKYAQSVVWNFTAGGMENTSATTMYDTAILDAKSLLDYDLDGLISHELAHQWFGDLMTCQSWEHIWLNEGWATYMSHLWFEHRDGRAAYEAGVRSLFDGVIANDKGALPDTPGMASRVYSDPWEPFRRAANPYGKGASILAMLRARLGDDAFFKGVALYIDRHKFTNVVTSDFRRALEDASGETLELFFAQWVFRPNIPRLTVTAAWDDASKSLTLSGSQTQTIDGLNPAFEFELPVWAHTPGVSDWTKGALVFTGSKAELKLAMSAAPDAIAFDPELTVIAEVSCDHPAARSETLASTGPTLNARMQALRGMMSGPNATKNPDSQSTLLASIVENAAEPVALRTQAVRTLAALKDHPGLSALATSPIASWEVRQSILEALSSLAAPGAASDLTRERVYKLLTRALQRDPSTRVRAAAIRGLGAMRTDIETVIAATSTPSQDDEIRRAAIDSLVAFDKASGLPAILALTKPGTLTRTRADAMGAAAKLSRHDRDACFAAFSACLADPEQRPRMAAGQALVELADPRGLKALNERLVKVADPTEQTLLNKWIKELSTKLGPG